MLVVVGENMWRKRSLQQRTMIQVYQYTCNGSRIINLTKLQEYLQVISEHAATCHLWAANAVTGKEAIVLVDEQNHEGFCSILTSRCVGCNKKFQFSTSSRVQDMSGGRYWKCNLASVWGRWWQGEDMQHLLNQWQYLAYLPCQRKHSCPLRNTLESGGRIFSRYQWNKLEGHCHLQGTLPPRNTSDYCDHGWWLE